MAVAVGFLANHQPWRFPGAVAAVLMWVFAPRCAAPGAHRRTAATRVHHTAVPTAGRSVCGQ